MLKQSACLRNNHFASFKYNLTIKFHSKGENDVYIATPSYRKDSISAKFEKLAEKGGNLKWLA
jgi:hypothetical protein